MNRGDVYFVAFDPAIGEEIQKTRPAVIVSNNANNKNLARVQVVPLTSSPNALKKCYSNEAMIIVAGMQGKALTSQLTTVSKLRLSQKIASVSHNEMHLIEEAIRYQLDL